MVPVLQPEHAAVPRPRGRRQPAPDPLPQRGCGFPARLRADQPGLVQHRRLSLRSPLPRVLPGYRLRPSDGLYPGLHRRQRTAYLHRIQVLRDYRHDQRESALCPQRRQGPGQGACLELPVQRPGQGAPYQQAGRGEAVLHARLRLRALRPLVVRRHRLAGAGAPSVLHRCVHDRNDHPEPLSGNQAEPADCQTGILFLGCGRLQQHVAGRQQPVDLPPRLRGDQTHGRAGRTFS